VTATAEKYVEAVLKKWEPAIRSVANRRHKNLPYAIKSLVDYDDLAQAARLAVAASCDTDSKIGLVYVVIRRSIIDEIRRIVGRAESDRNKRRMDMVSIHSRTTTFHGITHTYTYTFEIGLPQLHQWPTLDKITDIAFVKFLPKINRDVIEMHYGQGMLMDEIGRRLNLSQSRISQIHTASIKMIRQYCEENPHDY
jgi:RNA polymerase sigma factor (sigma-70 family)